VSHPTRPFHPLQLLFVAILATALAAPATSQEDREGPNAEPGTTETLFEPTSAGNVVQTATAHYHAGMRFLDKADKLEAKLPETPPDKLEKQQKKVDSAYESAIQELVAAIRTDGKLFKAYPPLARAYLATGKTQESLQVYGAALKVEPDNGECLAGRADVFLAINEVRAAAGSWNMLREAEHTELADQLMAAMKEWVARHQADPGDVDPALIEAFAGWIGQQEQASS